MPETPSTTSSAPDGGSSLASTNPPEWRAGDNYPEWLRGKTADEVAQLTTQLGGYLQQQVQQPQYQQPQQRPVEWSGGQIDDDTFIDGRTLKGILGQIGQMGGVYNQAIEHTLRMAADANLRMARQQHAKTFQKYGPEINAEIARLPLGQRTLDNLTAVVEVVRSRHIEDLAKERAAEMLANQDPSLRSGGTGAPPSGPTADALKFDNLPDGYKATLKRMGITWETVVDFCRANGEDPKTWLDQASKMGDNVIVDTGLNKRGTVV